MKRAMLVAISVLLMGQAAPTAGIASFEWMSGRWEAETAGSWTEEIWSTPRAGTMFGISRSGREDVLREFEFIRLQVDADGVPVYSASPGGRRAVEFRLVAHGRQSATFENPAHDFPQRIQYRRSGNRMVATISAIDGSNAMSWTFDRRR